MCLERVYVFGVSACGCGCVCVCVRRGGV